MSIFFQWMLTELCSFPHLTDDVELINNHDVMLCIAVDDDDELYGPPHLTDDIKELLVAVRGSLRHGMDAGMQRMRHGATNMRELSAKQVEQMRERAQQMRVLCFFFATIFCQAHNQMHSIIAGEQVDLDQNEMSCVDI